MLSITEYYVRKRLKEERFQDFVRRIGKKEIKDLLEDLTKIPDHDVDCAYYSDWGDPREFTLVDMIGELAQRGRALLEAKRR